MNSSPKKIIIFIAAVFLPTWLCWGILSLFVKNVNTGGIVQLVVGLSMWFPALGLLITRAVIKKGGKEEFPPVRPLFKPAVRANLKVYLAAWLVPAALTLLGGAVFFLIFPGELGLDSEFFKAIETAAQGRENARVNMTALVIIAQAAAGIFLGPFFNMFFGLGEELGWRGFLYPALREKLSPAKTIFAGGVIWGLWHAPITAMGHNYGFGYPGYPWTGILTMMVFCTSLGAFLFYITEKTGSIWPASLCHGAVNAIAGFPILFLKESAGGIRLLGPAITGLAAGLPLLALGIWCAMRLTRPKLLP